MSTFGKRLRKLRKSKKLTQKGLADLFSLAESTISMYERDEREPSFAITKKLADYFEVDTDYLLGRSDSLKYKDPLDQKVDELIKDPESQLFFKDYMSAPEEKQAQARNFLKYILQEEENKKNDK